MDRDVIENKLESLRHYLARVSEKCPDSAEKLATDPDAQDILTLNLTRSIQLCVDIAVHVIASTDSPPPTTMGASFDALAATGFIDNDLALKLKKSVGFRNIAIHNYEAVDWQIVFTIATQHLDDFKDFARHIIETLKP